MLANTPSQPVTPATPQQGAPQMVPLEEALFLKQQLDKALQELARLKNQVPAEQQPPKKPTASPPPGAAEAPPNTEISPTALEVFVADPVGFIQSEIQKASRNHLYQAREEAELQGSLRAFRRANPEAERFEPFILQEVLEIIQNDEDGVIDPWDKLLEKGLSQFKAKFKDMLKDNPELLEKKAAQLSNTQMEAASPRAYTAAPPSFSREQIAKMSLEEFLEHEAAINEALQSKRIH